MSPIAASQARRNPWSRVLPYALGAGLVFAGLLATRRYNYVLFHTLAEMFAVVVFMCIFVITFNARRFLNNNYLVFIGLAYLFVGGVDLLHALAYKGMGVFPGTGANLATQLWLLGRYLQTFSLLVAPLFLGRSFRARYAVAGLTVVTLGGLLTIFAWPIFPDAFLEETGLTAFKRISEYLLSAVLLGALGTLWSRRGAFEPKILALLSGSIAVTVASELCFTLYTDPYANANLIGHFLRIAAVFLFYKALVETALVEPYGLLFRELKRSEESHQRNEKLFRGIANTLQEALLSVPNSIPGLRFGHLYRSATSSTRVGGDFYDLFEIDNRKVGLLIGDVSGKGLKAATLTSVVKNTVRAHAFDRDPPATVMAKVNDCVLRVTDQTSWVSVFLAVYDRSTGTLTYCSAGHPPAVLLRREEDAHNEASFLLTRSPAVGAFSEVEFVEDTAHLGPEDILVLYTDGVIEARREGVLFGDDRLIEALTGLDGRPAGDIPRLLLKIVQEYSAGRLGDDIALVAVSPAR